MKIKVRVIPNAKKERILEDSGALRVYLTIPAREGRANKALIALLAKYHKVPKSRVKIIKGLKSRDKTIMIGEF